MFLILRETIKEQVLQKVGNDFFSILCHKVCDISNKEQLISFVQYIDQHSSKPDVKFLAVHYAFENLLSKSKAIKSMLLKQMAAAELNKTRLAGLATDGANVAIGKNNGVAALLHRECKLMLMFTAYAQISTCVW